MSAWHKDKALMNMFRYWLLLLIQKYGCVRYLIICSSLDSTQYKPDMISKEKALQSSVKVFHHTTAYPYKKWPSNFISELCISSMYIYSNDIAARISFCTWYCTVLVERSTLDWEISWVFWQNLTWDVKTDDSPTLDSGFKDWKRKWGRDN